MLFQFGQSSFYCFLVVVLSVGLGPTRVLAHNVVSGAYADGMMIEGEVGFSNGEMAQAGSPVKVYDAQGKLLAELTLTEGGAFSYAAKVKARHVFKADLSAGHVAEMAIEADELNLAGAASLQTPVVPESLNKQLTKVSMGSDETDLKPRDNSIGLDTSLGNNISIVQLESIVRSAVAQQVRPLQKELRAYKEKVMFRDITGGLGFIFGLFGVAAWMASKRKQGENNATVS